MTQELNPRQKGVKDPSDAPEELQPIDSFVWDLVFFKNGEERPKGPSGKKLPLLNEDVVNTYFRMLAATGVEHATALMAGMNYSTVKLRLQYDPEFAEAMETARSVHADVLRLEVTRRGLATSLAERVFDRNDAGKMVETRRVYKKSDQALLNIARSKCPELREKVEHDHRQRGGVLAIPGTIGVSIDNWIEKHSEE